MLCERLVVDQDPVEEFLVVRRHSEGRVFDKRKGDTVGGGKSFAEQKLPICEQPLEEIKGASESSAQQCEPLPVGFRGTIDKLVLDRGRCRFPGSLKPIDEELDFCSQRFFREQSRFRESALEVLENRGRSGYDASIIVLQNGHAALPADLDHGRAIGGIRIHPLNGVTLVGKCERDALYVGRERDSPDAHRPKVTISEHRRRRRWNVRELSPRRASSSSASSWPRRAEDASPVGSGRFHLNRYAASICDFFGGATPSSGASEERHRAVIADRREVSARTNRCSALDYLEIANEPARRREADRCHLIEADPEIWIAALPRQHTSEPAPDMQGVIPNDQASVVSAKGRRRHRHSVGGSRDIPDRWPIRAGSPGVLGRPVDRLSGGPFIIGGCALRHLATRRSRRISFTRTRRASLSI